MHKGSVYVYTLIICMIMIAMLSAVTIMNAYNKKISKNYNENGDLYNLATCGAEMCVKNFNDDILLKSSYINLAFENNISSINFMNNSNYNLVNANNKYDGNFSSPQILAMYKKSVVSVINNENISYNTNTTSKNYTTIANITSDFLGNFVVHSKCINNKNNVFCDTSGIVDFSQTTENLEFKFDWKNNIAQTPFNYGVCAIGKINGQFVNNYPIISNYLTENNIPINDTIYDNNNSIIVTNVGGTIDISNFSGDVLIFNNSTNDLNIITTNLSQTVFNGYIISNGNLILQNGLTFNGFIYCGGNLTIGKSVNFNYDASKIFNIKYSDEILYRKILDNFGITNFKIANLGANSNISNILNNVTIVGVKNINEQGKNAFTATISEFVQNN